MGRFTALAGRLLSAATVVAVGLLMTAAPAGAHTAFESSSPADGSVVEDPVTRITLTFTGEAAPAGEGFVVLDPTGTIVNPKVSSVDSLTWVLLFDEPLAGGNVGVRWTVAAADTHPIDGSFSFTVTAPADSGATPAAAPTATSPDSDSTPSGEAPADSASEDATTGDQAPSRDLASSSNVETGAGGDIDLDTFLDTEPSATGASSLLDLARTAGIIGVVLVVGGAAFAAYVLREDQADIVAVLQSIGRAGGVVAIGATVEMLAQVAVLAGSWSAVASLSDTIDTLWSSAGLAALLRLIGGVLVVVGFTAARTRKSDGKQLMLMASDRPLTPVGAAGPRPDNLHLAGAVTSGPTATYRWFPTDSVVGVAGAAALISSFALDGHTASEGPRWIHAGVNVIHVVVASFWAGGLAMLTVVVWRRRRRHAESGLVPMAVRFSVVATAAVAGAAVAGSVLTVIVLDSVSDIWSTDWGRLLLVKVSLVAMAAVAGGYNHRVAVPALDQAPGNQAMLDRFRLIVTLEAVLLLAVAIVTALLVGASSA